MKYLGLILGVSLSTYSLGYSLALNIYPIAILSLTSFIIFYWNLILRIKKGDGG